MKKDTVVELKKPEFVTEDPLTEVCRQGALELLKRALEAEVEEFLSRFVKGRDESGKRMITRNGYLPERNIQTGIGDIGATKHGEKELLTFVDGDRESEQSIDRLLHGNTVAS